MSNLPISNNEVYSQRSDTPDFSNPYSYPSNPVRKLSTNQGSFDSDFDENPNTSFNVSPSSQDPEISKLKSSFWKKAGQLQATIGSIAGLKSWELTGQKTEEDAEREYKDAEYRLNNGQASRIHGEYERLMGYISYAVGHVSGDKEMQERANDRTKHGLAEIDRTMKS